VIYARYSSAAQKDASIEQQYEACEAFAKREGYTVLERYPDRAISGRTDDRPAFKRMMKDAHTGTFDYVIAWKSNRLGRNMLQAMVNESKLAELGVRCLYVEEDFDDTAAGRFALRSMMNVNQFYSDNLAEDVRRGMMDNAQKCMVNGVTPFGYKRGEDGHFAIDEMTAPIVQEIFTRFRDGWSITELVDDLNARGIKTKYKRPWRIQSFQWLLKNDVYTGVYKYDNIRIEGGVPTIIDKELFEEVQQALKNKKRPRGQQRINADYLLTGKIFCGECGSNMIALAGRGKSGQKFCYYACAKRRRGEGCKKAHVRKEVVEKAVVNVLRETLSQSGFVEWVLSGYEKVIEAAKADTKLNLLQGELAGVNAALDNIMKAIEAGIINEMTKARMDELIQSRKDIQEAIRLEESASNIPDKEQVRAWLQSFVDGDFDDPEYMKQLIRVFVSAVYVYDDNFRLRFNYGDDADITIPAQNADPDVFAESKIGCTTSDPSKHFEKTARFCRAFFEVTVPFNSRAVL
jgi:DNA invertase Pin-like site-specific DNA recombinase